MSRWQSRILGLTMEAPDQLLAHPLNPRRHPGPQRDVLRATLDDVGFIAPVLVNDLTGHVIDGHLRIEEALTNGCRVPVVHVSLTAQEELRVLATLDPIGALAVYDADRLEELKADLGVLDPVIAEMLADLDATVIDDAPPKLPAEGRVFVVHLTDDQHGELWDVLRGVPGDSLAEKLLELARRY